MMPLARDMVHTGRRFELSSRLNTPNACLHHCSNVSLSYTDNSNHLVALRLLRTILGTTGHTASNTTLLTTRQP